MHINIETVNRLDNDYFPFIKDEKRVSDLVGNIRKRITDYIIKNELKSLVLGISGGIDSALCAVLLRPVCNQLGIPLVGRSIAIETNGKDEIERSLQVGRAFCHDFLFMDLTDTFYENRKNLIALDDTMLSKMRTGNMKARMRMIILYDLAQLYRGIVISTDNYTEYLTGFWTLHGDVGDYAPIMNLWKTEVFIVSKYLLRECREEQIQALQSCIDATPVDGLGISSHDCEQLKVADYYEADQLFYQYFVENNKTPESHPLIKRYHASSFKRANPISISRKDLLFGYE